MMFETSADGAGRGNLEEGNCGAPAQPILKL